MISIFSLHARSTIVFHKFYFTPIVQDTLKHRFFSRRCKIVQLVMRAKLDIIEYLM
jgi:hypothetical protein